MGLVIVIASIVCTSVYSQTSTDFGVVIVNELGSFVQKFMVLRMSLLSILSGVLRSPQRDQAILQENIACLFKGLNLTVRPSLSLGHLFVNLR